MNTLISILCLVEYSWLKENKIKNADNSHLQTESSVWLGKLQEPIYNKQKKNSFRYKQSRMH